jgi:hypothetical protein
MRFVNLIVTVQLRFHTYEAWREKEDDNFGLGLNWAQSSGTTKQRRW